MNNRKLFATQNLHRYMLTEPHSDTVAMEYPPVLSKHRFKVPLGIPLDLLTRMVFSLLGSWEDL